MKARCYLGVAVVAAVAAACGVPTEDSATRVARDKVPFGLAAPTSDTTVTTVPSASAEVTVYFVEGGRLVPTPRRISQPVSVADALDAVVAGPTEDEARAGRRSALLGSGLVNRASAAGGIATVDLGIRFTALPSDEQVLALAQLVYTATGLPGITAVTFTLNASPIPVPKADGSLTDAPVARADYAALVRS